ncbi:biotin--[acetyl-CoA-carboxylase] ligase [Bauldia sp.]|uniref:biotin--[acetyl-CoA-carboxylase] ligase n=1 Tax=Bauldia sp. TaxID=2575872 RepID=UPI003BA963A2
MTDFALGDKASAAGFRLKAFDTVGSTNAEALALARAGDPGGLWLTSRAQTAGRGRRGRAWSTEPGSLAATILTVVELSPERAATLGFVAGLALDDALRQVAPDLRFAIAVDGGEGAATRIRLKWPNDVLIDGMKVAGILLEAEKLNGVGLAVATGIGVNVTSAPTGVTYSAAALRDLAPGVDAPNLFRYLTDAWAGLIDVWDGGRGFPAIRQWWLERAAGIGSDIAVRVGPEVFSGVFESIDDEGRLLVRAADGSERAVTSGEVHFGVAATTR